MPQNANAIGFIGRALFGLSLSFFILGSTATEPFALEPARPDEIEKLKAEGTFEQSLKNALEVGNHKFSPDLVRKFQIKRQEMILRERGVPEYLLDRYMLGLPPGAQGGLPSSGAPKIFALLIEFQDYTHAASATDIDDILFGDGIAANYPYDSLTNFYDRSSHGLLDLSSGVTLGWYQTSYNRSNVPQTAAGRESLIKEALNHYDTLGHDFSQYDNNGDGVIEYFVVMWAGPTGSWATFWWGWDLGWGDSAYTIDGEKLRNYSWQQESTNPSTVIHETGHSLGLPDLYDYDNSVGPDGGVGGLDIMNSDGDHNCFSKWMLDWITPQVVGAGRQVLTLHNIFDSTDAVLTWKGIGLGDTFSEFFMVENRQFVGNDMSLWFAPDGLAVWHVDATLDGTGKNFAYNNSSTAHKLIRLMQADGLEEIEAALCGNGSKCPVANVSDLYAPGNEITHVSMPSSDKYDGSDSCVRVWDIVDLGSAPGAAISADFSTICNLPPTCDANGPYVAECAGTATDVPLDATGSSDPDAGDTLAYSWVSDCPGASLDDASSATPTLTVDSSPGCSVDCSAYLTASDSVGDPDSCSATVVISDTTPPNVTCPANVTVECDESTDPSNTGTATATDICDTTSLTVMSSDEIAPGTCPATSVITRTWQATDSCGNTGSCEQTITLVDTTSPAIQCNAPLTIAPANASISFMATATDNCDDDPSVEIVNYQCYKVKKGGKIVDKSESCEVDLSGDTITIQDAGGVGDIFRWTVNATDSCGNVSQQQCTTAVTHP